MSPSVAERLRHRLLDAGVAPSYARRLADEIDDHLRAATADECTAHPERAAEAVHADVLARLGPIEQMVAAARGDRRNLALTRRHPWIVFGATPVVTLVLTVVAYAVVATVAVDRALAPAGPTAAALVAAGAYGLGPLVVAAYGHLAWRTRAHPAWILLAGLVVAGLRAPMVARIDTLAASAPIATRDVDATHRLFIGLRAPVGDPTALAAFLLRPESLATMLAPLVVLLVLVVQRRAVRAAMSALA